MFESEIKVLEYIIKDLRKNPQKFNNVEIKKIITKLHNDYLKQRKVKLLTYSLNPIECNGTKLKEIIGKLGYPDIKLPSNKEFLVKIINFIAEITNQEIRVKNLINGAIAAKSAKVKSKSTKKNVQIENPKEIRNSWLLIEDFNSLKKEISSYKMNDIRTITAPWKENLNPRGTKKVDLIDAVIEFLKKQHSYHEMGLYKD